MPATPPVMHIGFGEVRHRRLRPRVHAFRARTLFLMIPMRAWARQRDAWVGRNRRTPIAFFDADHGDGGPDSLAWVESVLAQHGVQDADGEIWLQTYPRILGYAFKPVSFWYAHRADGTLRAVVAEVNNTFGERHSYVLTQDLAWGREVSADKAMAVSPFCTEQGRYRFRFLRGAHAGGAERLVARVDYDDEAGPLLLTSISGRLEPLGARTHARALLLAGRAGVGVTARILWHAAWLLIKRVPWRRGAPDSQPKPIPSR